MSEVLDEFVKGLHHTSEVLCYGKAIIMGQTVDAVLVSNLYNQRIVWGPFSIDSRKGKFIGKMANNANTEGVVFKFPKTLRVDLPPESPGIARLMRQWHDNLQYPNMSHELH